MKGVSAMTYYRAWVYRKDSLKSAILYFALEDGSLENMKNLYESFGWFWRMPNTISAVNYACAIVRYPVTNHVDCFKFRNAVVIE